MDNIFTGIYKTRCRTNDIKFHIFNF